MNLIISTTKNNIIGLNGQMLWNNRSDIERYKKITKGGILIMGNVTYKSLRNKRLRYHTNIVLTTDKNKKDLEYLEISGISKVIFVNSVEQAIEVSNEIQNNLEIPKEIFVIGGSKTARQFESFYKKIYHTIVDKLYYDNLPYTKYNVNNIGFKLIHSENNVDTNNHYKTDFKIYEKN